MNYLTCKQGFKFLFLTFCKKVKTFMSMVDLARRGAFCRLFWPKQPTVFLLFALIFCEGCYFFPQFRQNNNILRCLCRLELHFQAIREVHLHIKSHSCSSLLLLFFFSVPFFNCDLIQLLQIRYYVVFRSKQNKQRIAQFVFLFSTQIFHKKIF